MEEDAEPHSPSAKYSWPEKELHKNPVSPKPRMERSCSLLHTQSAPGKLWKVIFLYTLVHILLCTFAVTQSPLPTGAVCKGCCSHVSLKAENMLSPPLMLQIRHSGLTPLPNNTLQPGQSIVLTIPGTTATHGDEVFSVPGSSAKSLGCKMNSVWPLAVPGMKKLLKPKPLWRCNGEKKWVGEGKQEKRSV